MKKKIEGDQILLTGCAYMYIYESTEIDRYEQTEIDWLDFKMAKKVLREQRWIFKKNIYHCSRNTCFTILKSWRWFIKTETCLRRLSI